MVRRTRQQGVPVIRVDEQFIVGFDRERLEQALAASAGRPAALGAAIADAATVAARDRGVPPSGAYVGRVHSGTAAQRAGLRAGDVVVELDSASIETAADLATALEALGPHESFSLTFIRAGARRTARARL